MTTASPLPKYGLPVSRITAPTGVRPRCHAVAVKGGGLGGARSGRIIEDARRGSLRRPGLAASPRPTPDGCSRGIAHRGSRVRGAAQACRVAPSGRQSEKLNNGGEFRVFDRDRHPGHIAAFCRNRVACGPCARFPILLEDRILASDREWFYGSRPRPTDECSVRNGRMHTGFACAR
jgi:hypothetical protein